MSLITTAGLWNSEDDDITETKKTRRVSSQQQPSQNREEQREQREQKLSQNQQQMFGPSQYPDTNNVSAILNKINSINVKNAGDNLMKFNPIKPPEIQNKKGNDVQPQQQYQQQPQQPTKIKYDSPNLGDSYSNYKNIYTPPLAINENGSKIEGFSSKNNGNNGNNGNNLMEKINYAIHLLEQQQAQKTDHVIEELILYGFVGVFIIFVVDSFNKTAKYTR
jgi:hypothetical protein